MSTKAWMKVLLKKVKAHAVRILASNKQVVRKIFQKRKAITIINLRNKEILRKVRRSPLQLTLCESPNSGAKAPKIIMDL